MGTASCNGEEVITNFMGRTRESYECAICIDFFNDPVEVKCGHLFCRTCINRLLANQDSANSGNSQACPLCEEPIMKNDLKDVSPRMSKLTQTLQQFLRDFCREGGVKVTGTLSAPTNSSQQGSKTMSLQLEDYENKLDGQANSSNPSQHSSKTIPLTVKENEEAGEKKLNSRNQPNSKTQSLPSNERMQTRQRKSTTVETNKSSSDLSGRVCSAPSKLGEQKTQEPQHKVHQWLMTNVDSSGANNEEDCENAPTIRVSGSTSADSLSAFTLSSVGKDSYDIVCAPSPPPHPDEFPQMKRGRGGRRSSRPRKNALPISSGESSAKKRGRPPSRTPENKNPVPTTPCPPASSPELLGNFTTKTCAMTSTPMPDTPKEKADCTVRLKDSSFNVHNENSIMEEDFLTSGNIQEESNDSLMSKPIASENTLLNARTSSGTPNKPENRRSTETYLENRPVLQPISYIPVSSPQLEMLTNPPSTAQHLTPVARPKIRNSLTNVTNSMHRAVNDSRRHSSAEGLLRGVGQRTVSFLHKGRIVPRTPNTFKKQPIVFTCLGKLAARSKTSSDSNAILLDSSLTRKPEKSIETKENQTTTWDLVSVASVATQTEEVGATLTVATQPSAQLLAESQNSVVKEPVEQKSPLVSPTKSNGPTDRVTLIELDEYSEDAFMFAEPFKRTRVLSSSDSEDEKSEVKRRKSSPSAPSAINGPLSNATTEPKTYLPDKIPERVSLSDAIFKTVVLESDPESDEADMVPATPPCPRPKQSVVPIQRKVFTCSGLPRSQVKLIEDWARRIGAEISLTYTPAVTHVIVQLDEENCAQRTLKFLFGVASGKWIVGIDWVHKSIRENQLVDEEPFEALDMDGENGPQRARQRYRTNKLFQAFEFCCQEPFTDVTVNQLRELLELCGATTVSSPSELTKKRRHSMIIVQTDDEIGLEVQRKAASWFERLQVLSVSREWVLDCLASYQLLPIRSQLIGKHPESLLKLMGFDAQLIA